MKKLYFLLISLAVLLAGCTTTKDIRRQKQQQQSDKQSEINWQESSDIKTNTDTRTVSVTTITELADTTLKDPGSQVVGEKPLSDLENGSHLTIDTQDLSFDIFLDSKNRIIHAQATEKPDLINSKFNRKTEKKEFTDQKQDKQEKMTGSAALKEREKSSSSSDTLDKKVKRNNTLGVILAITGFLLLAGLGFLAFKWLKKRF